MDVISPTFTFQDFIPLILCVLILAIIGLIFGISESIRYKNSSAIFFGFLAGAIIGIIPALFAASSLETHHQNMVSDLEDRFEHGYNLTIVDNSHYADIPLTPGDEAEAVKVFLHELPGEQTILVEIVDGKYVVTHNGEVREVVNP